MPLEQELQTYTANKERLISESLGSFVVIKGEKIAGIFTSQEDALQAGYKEFGNTEFLVKKITEFEEINWFTRSVV